MYSYMIGREDVRSYRTTFDYSLKNFASKDPAEMAVNSGTVYEPLQSCFTVTSLGQQLCVRYPEGRITFGDSNHCPDWSWRLVVLNYLSRSDNAPLVNHLISYRELENGHVFYPAFHRESIAPLTQRLSSEPAVKIKMACKKLAGQPEDTADDVSTVFSFLPRFPVIVKIWSGDAKLPVLQTFYLTAPQTIISILKISLWLVTWFHTI